MSNLVRFLIRQQNIYMRRVAWLFTLSIMYIQDILPRLKKYNKIAEQIIFIIKCYPPHL